MTPEIRLEMVHLQLTKACNLNCWFCGQRKSNQKTSGFEADEAMKLDDWQDVIRQIKQYGQKTGVTPCVMIWGGEAMLSACFEPVVKCLSNEGFSLGMVTNGTLLHHKASLCREAFSKIYISVDGYEDLHDSIRGKGTFRRIKENMKLLRQGEEHPKLILVTVITKELMKQMEKLWEAYDLLKPDEVLLQEMIGLTSLEIQQYNDWKEHVGQNQEGHIESWKWSLNEAEIMDFGELNRGIAGRADRYSIKHVPHGQGIGFCLSPFRHLHIRWNGETAFCTDFTDVSIGNVKQENVIPLFYSQPANLFREEVAKGNCVTCRHCSWIGKQDYLEL